MEWIGNMGKKIGFVAGVLKEALFNDSAPTVMNSYVNRCVCQHISVKLWAGGSVRKEVLPFSKRSRPDLAPHFPPSSMSIDQSFPKPEVARVCR
jgi:hypothetical protein